jgi:hypothetical protein
MRSTPHSRGLEQDQEPVRRYGLDRDPREGDVREVELAEHASPPPVDVGTRGLARYRLGGGPSPFERPGAAPLPRLAAGEAVTNRGEDGAGPARHGTVPRLAEEDGAAVVAFDGGGETAVTARRSSGGPPDGYQGSKRLPVVRKVHMYVSRYGLD